MPYPLFSRSGMLQNLDTPIYLRVPCSAELLMNYRLNCGGLNQQRIGICDAVNVAKILNATLIIPHLEVNPVWQDSSNFMDIFEVDYFINLLKDDIVIVKELPDDYFWSTQEYYATAVRAARVKTAPRHASANWYLENVLPVLQSYGIAAIAPFSHRLAFDNMPEDIQRLRCEVNFQALDFVPHIGAIGDALREVSDSKNKQGTGNWKVCCPPSSF